jgi:hypothetical protein
MRKRMPTKIASKEEEDSEQEIETNAMPKSVQDQRADLERYWEATEATQTGDAAQDEKLNKARKKELMHTVDLEHMTRFAEPSS